MKEGWILLHRKIQDCEIWSNSQPFDMRSAWVDLLLLANHRDVEIIFDYKPMTIKRGQYLTSVRKLGERWSWSKNRVLKFLKLLESLQMIERQSNKQRTLLTIVKYEIYQCSQDTDEDTGMDTPMDTGMDTGMPQTKNEKNEKNEKNNKHIRHKYGEFKHVLLSDEDMEKLKADYQDEVIERAITILDEYIEKSGRKYKNHYLVFKDWTLERAVEDVRKGKNGSERTESAKRNEEQRNAEHERYVNSDEYKNLVGTDADMPFM